MGAEEELQVAVFFVADAGVGEAQQLAGHGMEELVVVAGGAVESWWRRDAAAGCGGAPPRLAWPRRRPVVEKKLGIGDRT